MWKYCRLSTDTDGFVCSFDSPDYCGWTNDRTANFNFDQTFGAADWQERTGPTSGANSMGPYLNADTSASGANPGRVARFMSPPITAPGKLRFGHNT